MLLTTLPFPCRHRSVYEAEEEQQFEHIEELYIQEGYANNWTDAADTLSMTPMATTQFITLDQLLVNYTMYCYVLSVIVLPFSTTIIIYPSHCN